MRRFLAKPAGFLPLFLPFTLLCQPANGATFCVASPTDLSTALLTPEGNGEDDTVRIEQGFHAGNFIYSSGEANLLRIEGGYLPGCATRDPDPGNTILDGSGFGTTLALASSQSADYDVDAISIQGGAGVNGGCMFVLTSGGQVTLTRLVWDANSAIGTGGGLHAQAAGSLQVTDSVFSGNGAGDSVAGSGRTPPSAISRAIRFP